MIYYIVNDNKGCGFVDKGKKLGKFMLLVVGFLLVLLWVVGVF